MLVNIERSQERGLEYKLKFIDDDDFGMINLDGSGILDDNEPEFQRIKHIDDLIIVEKNINIFYPAYDIYFKQNYSSETGFTLKKILQLINKTGYNFHYDDYLRYPEHYTTIVNTAEDAADCIGEYAVCSFYIDNNNIYVEINH